MTTHYVCPECKGVSKSATTCSLETCINQGMPLKECHCDDNQHQGIMPLLHEDSDSGIEEAEGTHITTIDLDSNSTA